MKKARFLVIAALALLSSTAFAEGNVAQIGKNGTGGSFETLEAALNAVANADTVYLLQDVTFSTSYQINDGSEKTVNMNNHTIYCSVSSFSGCAFEILHGKLSFCGNGEFRGAGKLLTPDPPTDESDWGGWAVFMKLRGSVNTNDENYSVLNIGEDVTFNVEGLSWCPIGILGNKSNTKKSFGTVVNLYGDIKDLGAWYAFSINGTIQETSDFVPEINIEGSEITLADNPIYPQDVTIYEAGYANLNITDSRVEGNTVIYLKAGSVIIDNSTIYANGEYSDVKAVSGGVESTGDAITIDSKLGYCGNMQLTVTGNSIITSENAYAVREELSDAQTSNTIGIKIYGGTFTGAADKGAIYYSDDLQKALIDGSSESKGWVVNDIKAGLFSSNPYITADNYVTVETATGFTVQLAPADPQPGEKVYITSSTTVENQTVPTNTEIIVQTGATYTVGNVLNVTEDLSKVTVKPGGTLIAGSIVSDSTHQFVVESDLTYGTGVVKYTSDSEVDSPKGTVQLALAARYLGNDKYKFQHFGIPTTGAPDKLAKSIQIAACEWDRLKSWVYVHSADALDTPFEGYNITTPSDATDNVIGFQGDIITNQNAEFTLNHNAYTALANSYTAPMDIQAIHESLAGVQTDKELWIYFANEAGDATFKHIAPSYYLLDNPEIFKLPAMQGFFLGNYGAETSFTLTYADAMSDGAVKDAEVSETDGGALTLSDGVNTADLYLFRNDDYTEISGGKQFDVDALQIYVTEGNNKWATFKYNSFENQYVEIKTKAATKYTLTFSRLMNNGYNIVDLDNPEKEIEVKEGGIYEFDADANSTLKRFKLSKGTLDAEEAEATELDFWTNDNTLYVANAEADIVVYNAAGVKVASVKADGSSVQAINIASLANGLYIVESGALTGKFIK